MNVLNWLAFEALARGESLALAAILLVALLLSTAALITLFAQPCRRDAGFKKESRK